MKQLDEMTLGGLKGRAYQGKRPSVSNLTQKYYNIRKVNENTFAVEDAAISSRNQILDVTLRVASTYRNGQSVYMGAVRAEPGYYHIILRFKNIGDCSEFLSYRTPDQIRQIQWIMNNCDVLLYSDDPSFYYQGCWEDLAKEGLSLFKFVGPSGKGIWHDRHNASGGLANENIHLTKHIAALLDAFPYLATHIASVIRARHAVKESLEPRYCNLREKKMSDVLDSIRQMFGNAEDIDDKSADEVLQTVRNLTGPYMTLRKRLESYASNPETAEGNTVKYAERMYAEQILRAADGCADADISGFIRILDNAETLAADGSASRIGQNVIAGMLDESESTGKGSEIPQVDDIIPSEITQGTDGHGMNILASLYNARLASGRNTTGKGELFFAIVTLSDINKMNTAGADLVINGLRIEEKAAGGRLDSSGYKAVSLSEQDTEEIVRKALENAVPGKGAAVYDDVMAALSGETASESDIDIMRAKAADTREKGVTGQNAAIKRTAKEGEAVRRELSRTLWQMRDKDNAELKVAANRIAGYELPDDYADRLEKTVRSAPDEDTAYRQITILMRSSPLARAPVMASIPSGGLETSDGTELSVQHGSMDRHTLYKKSGPYMGSWVSKSLVLDFGKQSVQKAYPAVTETIKSWNGSPDKFYFEWLRLVTEARNRHTGIGQAETNGIDALCRSFAENAVSGNANACLAAVARIDFIFTVSATTKLSSGTGNFDFILLTGVHGSGGDEKIKYLLFDAGKEQSGSESRIGQQIENGNVLTAKFGSSGQNSNIGLKLKGTR